MSCSFCSMETEKVIYQNEHFYAIYDHRPVIEGHALVISKRHYPTLFDMEESEYLAYREAILKVKQILDKNLNPEGYNLGVNCGRIAGQTVFHFHLHIIPRWADERKHRSFINRIRGYREIVSELL